ncbi:hypothetical protein C0J52_14102 [Blattella germanica]|nr:hypothetical protein C0J52_14102 [Blattella germanica]
MHLLWTALLISFSSQSYYLVRGNPNSKPLSCQLSIYDHNVFHYYCNNIKIENLYIDNNPRTFTHLYFRNCSIRNVIQNAFDVVPNMVHLDLSHNYISRLQEETFNHSRKLEYLDLSFNILQKLDGLLFENLVNLRYLNISFNKLDILDNTETFKSQRQLSDLSIAGNMLKTLKKDVLKPLTALKTLDLRNNPFICDCEFISIVKWSDTIPDVPTFTCDNNGERSFAKDLGFLSCSESQDMRSVAAKSLNQWHATFAINNISKCIVRMHLLWTALLISFSSQRNYSVKGNPNGKPQHCIVGSYNPKVHHYNCNNIKIENLYIDNNPRTFTHLYFRNCSIRNVIQDAFYVVPNMVHLDLRDNYISSLPEQTFKHSRKLEYLDLSFNILQKLDGLLFENLVNLRYLYISFNKLDILDNTETFKSQGQLSDLSIAVNLLKTLKTDVLKPLTALKRLDLRNNTFNCDCEFLSVVNWTDKVSVVPTFTCKNGSMRLSAKDIAFLLCNESQKMKSGLNRWHVTLAINIAICMLVIFLVQVVILSAMCWWRTKTLAQGRG